MTDMSATQSVVVPTLDIDKGRKLSPSMVLQRRISANLLDYLNERGWMVEQVSCDGDDWPAHTAKDAMELIHDLGYSDVTFMDAEQNSHGVKLIPSNNTDMIANWTLSEGDADGFNAVMEGFDAEDYA
jgi:hypothetical protein